MRTGSVLGRLLCVRDAFCMLIKRLYPPRIGLAAIAGSAENGPAFPLMSFENEYAELCKLAEAARQNALDSFLWRGGLPDTRKDQEAVNDWARAFAMASVAFPEASERERDQL